MLVDLPEGGHNTPYRQSDERGGLAGLNRISNDAAGRDFATSAVPPNFHTIKEVFS